MYCHHQVEFERSPNLTERQEHFISFVLTDGDRPAVLVNQPAGYYCVARSIFI